MNYAIARCCYRADDETYEIMPKSDFDECRRLGISTKEDFEKFKGSTEFEEMKDTRFTTKVWFDKCKLMGFKSRSEFVHCQRMNCLTKAEFNTLKKSPVYEELTSMGFTTKADYDNYKRMSRAVSNKSWGTPLHGNEAHDVLNFKSRAEFDDYRH